MDVEEGSSETKNVLSPNLQITKVKLGKIRPKRGKGASFLHCIKEGDHSDLTLLIVLAV